MDITGARWGLEGAEAILKLRAVIATGDFDAYWTLPASAASTNASTARFTAKASSSQRNQLTSQSRHFR